MRTQSTETLPSQACATSHATSVNFIGTQEASLLLGLTRGTVAKLARSGHLTGYLIEKLRKPAPNTEVRNATRPTIPHPWKRAEQRRLAKLSGWKSIPEIRRHTPRRLGRASTPAYQSRPGDLAKHRARVWQFRRVDVLAFRNKRATEAKQRQRQSLQRKSARLFGLRVPRVQTMKALRVQFMSPRRWRMKSRREGSEALDRRYAGASSISKLLAWAAPTKE